MVGFGTKLSSLRSSFLFGWLCCGYLIEDASEHGSDGSLLVVFDRSFDDGETSLTLFLHLVHGFVDAGG